MTSKIKIRKFNAEDSNSIREICCDNAFFGKPIDDIFEDRKLFADIFTDYYIKKEPEHIFVAELNNNVVGYLTGSVKKNSEILLLYYQIKAIIKILFKIVFRRYKNKNTYEFSKSFLRHYFFNIPKNPKNSAHLHFNVNSKHRNEGIGVRLIIEFEKMLFNKNINKYYGQFYEGAELRNNEFLNISGFKDFNLIETKIFEKFIDKKIYIRTVQKNLTKDNLIINLLNNKDLKMNSKRFLV